MSAQEGGRRGRDKHSNRALWIAGACTAFAHFMVVMVAMRVAGLGFLFVLVLVDWPFVWVLALGGLVLFMIVTSAFWFGLGALVAHVIRGIHRDVRRFIARRRGAPSRPVEPVAEEPQPARVLIPGIAVSHVVKALEDEIASQAAMSRLPEERQPSDFDRNDIALFATVLAEVRSKASATGAVITYPWTKAVQFAAAPIAQYASRNRDALTPAETRALEEVVRDIKSCDGTGRPPLAPVIAEPT